MSAKEGKVLEMLRKRETFRKTALIGWTAICLIAGFGMATILDPISNSVAQSPGSPPGVPVSFADLAKKAKNSVVNISTVKVIKGADALRS
jgi:hypothetical protein